MPQASRQPTRAGHELWQGSFRDVKDPQGPQPDPVGVLTTMRRLASHGGSVLVVDERTEDTFTVPTNEMERLFYAFSTLHCLSVSLQGGGVGTGTVIRGDTVRQYAADAGFDAVEVLDVEHPQFVLYQLT